ncbi:hypothetical protein NDU88_004009, partial [Pleurodeles waltl]
VFRKFLPIGHQSGVYIRGLGDLGRKSRSGAFRSQPGLNIFVKTITNVSLYMFHHFRRRSPGGQPRMYNIF